MVFGDVACFAVSAAAVVALVRSRRERGKSSSRKRSGSIDVAGKPLRVLRKCETILQARTSSLTIIVLERTGYAHNYSAALRTAEALGCSTYGLLPLQI